MFCESLRKYAMEIINFKKKKMKLLISEQQKPCENLENCYICQEKFEGKYVKDKKYRKGRDYCHYTEEYIGATHSTCNLKCGVAKEIPIVFLNGPNYDYHLIMKELAEEFRGDFTCLGVTNTEKYITFSVPIEKRSSKH